MNKLRASFTYLNLWSQGNWEMAIKAYFKLDKYITREMAEGSDYHDQWRDYIQANKKLPEVFGSLPLPNPQCEGKTVIPVYNWLDLVIQPDCVDGQTIYEFKAGTAESDEYARSWQPAVYAVGLVLLKQPVKYVDIYAYNQYSKRTTYSRVVITKKLLIDGKNWIETVGADMYDYFSKENLWERYGKVVS
jgi:hypothetical protein